MEDLLIFRPFDRSLFCQGNLEGPELLLKVLRGEQIDWQAIEERHMPSHMCQGCDTKQFKAEFSEGQWKRLGGRRYCKSCEKILSCSGDRKQCSKCEEWKNEECFDAKNWRQRLQDKICCYECGELRRCRGKCGELKSRKEFSTDEEWRQAGFTRKRGPSQGKWWKCVEYGQQLKL